MIEPVGRRPGRRSMPTALIEPARAQTRAGSAAPA
jgi:hypothetical protein